MAVDFDRVARAVRSEVAGEENEHWTRDIQKRFANYLFARSSHMLVPYAEACESAKRNGFAIPVSKHWQDISDESIRLKNQAIDVLNGSWPCTILQAEVTIRIYQALGNVEYPSALH